MPVFNANSVDLDQTPRSAASDLGLHYLPMSICVTLGINGLMKKPLHLINRNNKNINAAQLEKKAHTIFDLNIRNIRTPLLS